MLLNSVTKTIPIPSTQDFETIKTALVRGAVSMKGNFSQKYGTIDQRGIACQAFGMGMASLALLRVQGT